MKYPDYVPLTGFCTPAYRFIEGENVESFWVDSQNCYILTVPDGDETLIDGKNYWIIEPAKPKGMKIDNEEQFKQHCKWLVFWSSIEDDEDKEWDFKEHKPYD